MQDPQEAVPSSPNRILRTGNCLCVAAEWVGVLCVTLGVNERYCHKTLFLFPKTGF